MFRVRMDVNCIVDDHFDSNETTLDADNGTEF